MSRLFIALAFVAGIASSPALARATNPSERPAHAERQLGRTFAPGSVLWEEGYHAVRAR